MQSDLRAQEFQTKCDLYHLLWRSIVSVVLLTFIPNIPALAQHPATFAHAIVLPKARPEIVQYNRLWYGLYFGGIVWGFLGLYLLLRSGLSARMRDLAERKAARPLARVAIYYVLFSGALLLWRLPLGLIDFQIEKRYGFATNSTGQWLVDHIRGYVIGLPEILAVWMAYLLLERRPATWWLWLWAAVIPWLLTMQVLYPVLISPLYNKFVPLANGPLRAKLTAQAERAGIHGADIYVVDISRRTTKLNAYVTGVGPTKRIVLWDTLLKALPEDQILAIMGHEMGHYVLGHMWVIFFTGVFGAFVLLWLLARILPWAAARFGPRFGIRSLHDLAGLPLAMLVLNGLLFLQTPVESAISRYTEHQADRFGLELTHLNEPTARAFVTFVEKNYDDPDPPRPIVWWFYSHPPLRDRVEFALSYRPWLQQPVSRLGPDPKLR